MNVFEMSPMWTKKLKWAILAEVCASLLEMNVSSLSLESACTPMTQAERVIDRLVLRIRPM